jgi:hypothetical protein
MDGFLAVLIQCFENCTVNKMGLPGTMEELRQTNEQSFHEESL